MDRQITNLVITGFSGTGKSLVGKEAARRLCWGFLDTDDEIVRQAGKSIVEIFRCEGETEFRELERGAIEKASRRARTVIAVGGGAVVDLRNYELLARTGLIICLEAKPETIYERLFREAACGSGTEVRPLLAGEKPLERIRQLKASRQPHYARADRTIQTDDLTVDEVAGEVVRAWKLLGRTDSAATAANDAKPADHRQSEKDLACAVQTETQSYPVYVGYGLLDRLGEKMQEAGLSGTAITIADENVFSLYGDSVETALKDAGFSAKSFVVPPGEEMKAIEYAIGIYDFLVKIRAERDDVIVALGGGVIGDLAGFVAATFLRGMRWVQVPTTLAAMVDASIGGKVGVNHPSGKNLIGAFYQPNLVLADPGTLTSLPRRELTSGWAEVIKYGLILDKEFFESVESNVDGLVRLNPSTLTRTIGRGAAIKARVVSQDEKERKGERTILNYGHTVGHALEAATGYGRFLHGEAVAIGMTAAARLSQRTGLLAVDAVERQEALLHRFGLPTSLEADAMTKRAGKKRVHVPLTVAAITRAMELDKKVKGKAIHWVLLEDIGRAVIRSHVPQRDVSAVLRELAER